MNVTAPNVTESEWSIYERRRMASNTCSANRETSASAVQFNAILSCNILSLVLLVHCSLLIKILWVEKKLQ